MISHVCVLKEKEKKEERRILLRVLTGYCGYYVYSSKWRLISGGAMTERVPENIYVISI